MGGPPYFRCPTLDLTIIYITFVGVAVFPKVGKSTKTDLQQIHQNHFTNAARSLQHIVKKRSQKTTHKINVFGSENYVKRRPKSSQNRFTSSCQRLTRGCPDAAEAVWRRPRAARTTEKLLKSLQKRCSERLRERSEPQDAPGEP